MSVIEQSHEVQLDLFPVENEEKSVPTKVERSGVATEVALVLLWAVLMNLCGYFLQTPSPEAEMSVLNSVTVASEPWVLPNEIRTVLGMAQLLFVIAAVMGVVRVALRLFDR